ncbi:hypothetical protein T4D_5053 [Trichinella pseudospiralis]|uniref:Uncharacterized protein n=1 Tax=Trichinella pseudospiralis TaxID=6337 RepID=A0A0V1FYR6_TRIPS|nr:hypothetical protein T4D_5053 [Trichinella pseudospiralis]
MVIAVFPLLSDFFRRIPRRLMIFTMLLSVMNTCKMEIELMNEYKKKSLSFVAISVTNKSSQNRMCFAYLRIIHNFISTRNGERQLMVPMKRHEN